MIHTLKTMTPEEFKAYVQDIEVVYGFHPTKFGEALILTTPQGICGLAFTTPENRKACFTDMTRSYASARFIDSPSQTRPLINALLAEKSVPLLLSGTPFQLKVWQALLDIPCGQITSYDAIARSIGLAKAYRTVGNAIGRNPISYAVPCHRVVCKSGFLGGYRWGVYLKSQLLEHEGAQGWKI